MFLRPLLVACALGAGLSGTASMLGAADLPFPAPGAVVINEVLAHSNDDEPDLIELHNRTATAVDLSGWYLSDDPLEPQKYRIAPGVVLPAGGYLVFSENAHFGAASVDPGALTPFALSENGENVCLFVPATGPDPEYVEIQDFGASPTGVSFGRYFKTSTQTTNFVAMARPTFGAANSLPLVGPIVISEIMYHPAGEAASEYLELTNISSAPVTLFDAQTGVAWAFTAGITYTFPSGSPVTLASGARLILTRNVAAFQAAYSVPPGTRVLAWTAGALDNSGETLEISAPGDVNGDGVRQYIRVDRVVYDEVAPWPVSADGTGPGLTRVNLFTYGNDHPNWVAAAAGPGAPLVLPGYAQAMVDAGLSAGAAAVTADPDGDGLANLVEYAFGTSPSAPDGPPAGLTVTPGDGSQEVVYALAVGIDDVELVWETRTDLAAGAWLEVTDFTRESTAEGTFLRTTVPTGPRHFFRLSLTRR